MDAGPVERSWDTVSVESIQKRYPKRPFGLRFGHLVSDLAIECAEKSEAIHKVLKVCVNPGGQPSSPSTMHVLVWTRRKGTIGPVLPCSSSIHMCLIPPDFSFNVQTPRLSHFR